MLRISCFIVSLFFMTSLSFADEYRDKINDGYDYYRNGEYDKAADYFGEAGVLKPDKALPDFDRGGALYRSNDFKGAAEEFGSAISKGDEEYLADYHYNLGNTLYKSEMYGEAIKSYINALKMNPDDNDYKHNLELSLLKQRQQQQQQNQDQNQKENDKKEQEQGQNRDREDQKDQNEQQQESQKQENQQEQNQKQQASEDQQQMTEEEARNLLSRFEEDEKEIQKRLKQVNLRGRSIYDW